MKREPGTGTILTVEQINRLLAYRALVFEPVLTARQAEAKGRPYSRALETLDRFRGRESK